MKNFVTEIFDVGIFAETYLCGTFRCEDYLLQRNFTVRDFHCKYDFSALDFFIMHISPSTFYRRKVFV